MEMKKKSLLVNGLIPAHTECPFCDKCHMIAECNHQGKNHIVEYSCEVAQAMDLTQQYKPE
jgi:hypothetical protein